jgi:hypothetical protein
VVSGGVVDQSTSEEAGPVPGEALAAPRPIPVLRRAGDPSPTHGTVRAHVSSAGGDSTSARIEVSHRTGHRSRGGGGPGVGGLQRSKDVGARQGTRDPAERRRPVWR